jgi:anthranilate/para-aminobenzoate synthase component II
MAKVLIIDNHTKRLKQIKRSLGGHHTDTVLYHQGLNIDSDPYDLVVLSGGGGEGREAHSKHRGQLWYINELEFILNNKKPTLGICMGFELIAQAYGSRVPELSRRLRGYESFMTRNGQLVTQYEAHKYAIHDVSSTQFEVLAESESGIEIIKHKHRPLIATQFHPELGGTLSVSHLFKELKIAV